MNVGSTKKLTCVVTLMILITHDELVSCIRDVLEHSMSPRRVARGGCCLGSIIRHWTVPLRESFLLGMWCIAKILGNWFGGLSARLVDNNNYLMQFTWNCTKAKCSYSLFLQIKKSWFVHSGSTSSILRTQYCRGFSDFSWIKVFSAL